MPKAILLIMDSVGIGSLPDAADYGDEGSNTLNHIAEAVGGLRLPNLDSLGLGKITSFQGTNEAITIKGIYGKMGEVSKGKDTTTGHWEIAGIITKDPMPTFPEGFPAEIIQAFEERIGRRVLGNKPASGTEIIQELGEEHIKTGSPIVYTSADSVFQIAAHEKVIPLEELYRMCKIARELLQGDWAVGRVIARPFIGELGSFTRTTNRHDYSLEPPKKTILDILKEAGKEVISVGKIYDIFAGHGLTKSYPTISNLDGLEKTKKAWDELKDGLIFTNLVEFDSKYGHRNDPLGYGEKLEELDRELPTLMELVSEEGLLLITADHGNDPTTLSTDHSREYVPLLIYGKDIKEGYNLGIRPSFADIAATLAEVFDVSFDTIGKSFLNQIRK